jgi:zinc protease
VPKITLAQLRAFHAKAYAAGNAVIALVGDLPRRSRGDCRPGIGALPKGPALAKIAQPPNPKPA